MKIAQALAVSLLVASVAFSQAPSMQEQGDLMRAVTEGGASPIDQIRALEAHLQKYPATAQRADIETKIARAAIDAKDTPRIVKYGELALRTSPGDVVLLDSVTSALLEMGGKDNADRAYSYARALENILDTSPREPGRNAARRQDERDHAVGTVLLYQSRARIITGENQDADRLASRSFSAYPCEESAREWAEVLWKLGRQDDAITHLAEAFTIPDSLAKDERRLEDRLRLGEWYSKLHGSEKGLGDLILAAYDHTSTLMETRRKKLLALEPNAGLADPFEFTITGLDGKKLRLASLKGKLLILDFWATWCEPCRAQHPLYLALRERFRARPEVVFLEINSDDDRSLVDPFLTAMMWDKTVYFDDGLSRLLNVTNIPAAILIDPNGRLASRVDGFEPNSFVDTMTERIQSILSH
jgi:thiol-disulfide isomerase/thioredoxin